VKVLIIDDDEDLRNILAHYLKQEWPDVVVEQFDPLERDMPDASFALGGYDVMILDYMLGRGDGLEWLAAFKRRADCPKILFLTGAGNEIIAVRAIKADTCRGPVQFDKYGNVVGNIYIRKVERKDGRLVNRVIHTYPNVSQFWTYKPEEFLKNPVYSRDFPPYKNLEG